MNRIKLRVVAAAALVSFSGVAFAGDQGWYLFGSVGQTTDTNDKSILDDALTSAGASGFSSSLKKPTVYGLEVGYQVDKNFAIEGGYIGSNNEDYNASGGTLAGPVSASAHVDGWDLKAVGILPLADQFSLLGKLGVAHVHESYNITGPGSSLSGNGSKTSATYGIGAKYNFNNAVSVRIDVDSYNVGSAASYSRTSVWTIGLVYNFF